ncbi:hypothetical protein D5086_010363 [Populus alba]|uniref:Uncharacterized protein n=1 Tax=Populus alba TaxID=43335 RepID=A0ACC4CAR0_POPAL
MVTFSPLSDSLCGNIFFLIFASGFSVSFISEVNVPKTKKTYCKNKECKKHTLHKVTQYKKGKDSLAAQGKRRYDRKQSGYGGKDNKENCVEAAMPGMQTRVSARNQGWSCKRFFIVVSYLVISTVLMFVTANDFQRCKHFEIGGDKKGKGTSLF